MGDLPSRVTLLLKRAKDKNTISRAKQGYNVMRTHGSILVFYDAASHAKGLSSHALLRGLSKAAGSPGEEKTPDTLISRCG